MWCLKKKRKKTFFFSLLAKFVIFSNNIIWQSPFIWHSLFISHILFIFAKYLFIFAKYLFVFANYLFGIVCIVKLIILNLLQISKLTLRIILSSSFSFGFLSRACALLPTISQWTLVPWAKDNPLSSASR